MWRLCCISADGNALDNGDNPSIFMSWIEVYIMNEYNYENDVPKYKKKSAAKAPKKAKHKHLCEPCILEYPVDWWNKEHLRKPEMKSVIGAYCPICGKIGEVKNREIWYTRDNAFIGNMQFTETVLTVEGQKQINKETRTIPTFRLNDPFDKFVTLSESEDEDDV